MGASKSTANATKNAERSMPESQPVKAAETSNMTSNKLPVKEAALVTPISLPTKSWRSLLQEQSLSADAKPFVPNQAPPPRQAPATTQADDDPEWMQYLGKKFESKKIATDGLEASSVPLPSNTLKPKGKGKGKSKGAGTASWGTAFDDGGGFGGKMGKVAQGGNTGAAGGNSMLIQTEAYLKLLKEGTTRKAPANNQTARRTQNKNKAWLTPEGMDDAAQSAAIMPLTTSSLAKKWSSVVSKQSCPADDTAEELVVVKHTTQDDIGIEETLFDQDLSDPAYCSDTEIAVSLINTKNNASIHRLGRRPKAASAKIRTYVMQDLCFLLDRAVGMLLLRLQRFMDCQRIFNCSDSISEEQARHLQQRRFVIGLKEVSRRTKQSKVECLIIAPDIEGDVNSGGLDDRMRELLASAYQSQTPVIFALSRSRLGKALGKSLHISVLGVLDSTGARGLLDESLQRATDCRQAWLARLEK